MPIIKSTHSSAANAVVLDLGDLAAQAERLLAEARAKAGRITQRAIDEAEDSIERARKVAEEEGFAKGLARGLEEGRAEARAETMEKLAPRLEQLVEGWAAALGDIESRREQILRDAGNDVTMLAVALGRKVAHRIVETDPMIVADQVAKCLELLRRPADVQVRVHPHDRPLVEDLLPELVARFSHCRHLHLRDDESVGYGGCVIVTEAGTIDASIGTQLDRIAEALVPGRRGRKWSDVTTVLGDRLAVLERLDGRRVTGSVAAVRGLSVLVDDLPLPVGATVSLPGTIDAAGEPAHGEIVGFDGPRSVVMLLRATGGLAPGAAVVGEHRDQTVAVGDAMLGRIIDGLGRPIDGGPPPAVTVRRPLVPPPTGALCRHPIDEPLPTGVRAIDGMLTIGRGQRLGIFSGPGVGKSTLIASVARHCRADVSVVALIGERGREVREFIEGALEAEGLARSVVVVATGDESPLMRVRAALLASAAAEHFRDQGLDVVLLMDSVSRFAQAMRQVGLAVGEAPATKGYTPSVFAQLPVLLERAGAIEGGGSITGFYAVLIEGDDLNEPISDAVRGILDGHIALSRELASRGHHPAIDLLHSVSRVADRVCDETHVAARRQIPPALMAAYAEIEELINIGAYAAGSNPTTDLAIALKPEIDAFLQQDPGAPTDYPETCRRLVELAVQAGRSMARSNG